MINSIWHTVTKTEIRSSSTPIVSNKQSVVLSKYSMISLGTEKLVVNKKVPKAIEDYMTVPYMEGSFNLPLKYGYALSGILDSGEKVHVMHPHQETSWIEEKESRHQQSSQTVLRTCTPCFPNKEH